MPRWGIRVPMRTVDRLYNATLSSTPSSSSPSHCSSVVSSATLSFFKSVPSSAFQAVKVMNWYYNLRSSSVSICINFVNRPSFYIQSPSISSDGLVRMVGGLF